jgi:hypothetical protein
MMRAVKKLRYGEEVLSIRESAIIMPSANFKNLLLADINLSLFLRIVE